MIFLTSQTAYLFLIQQGRCTAKDGGFSTQKMETNMKTKKVAILLDVYITASTEMIVEVPEVWTGNETFLTPDGMELSVGDLIARHMDPVSIARSMVDGGRWELPADDPAQFSKGEIAHWADFDTDQKPHLRIHADHCEEAAKYRCKAIRIEAVH